MQLILFPLVPFLFPIRCCDTDISTFIVNKNKVYLRYFILYCVFRNDQQDSLPDAEITVTALKGH